MRLSKNIFDREHRIFLTEEESEVGIEKANIMVQVFARVQAGALLPSPLPLPIFLPMSLPTKVMKVKQ